MFEKSVIDTEPCCTRVSIINHSTCTRYLSVLFKIQLCLTEKGGKSDMS